MTINVADHDPGLDLDLGAVISIGEVAPEGVVPARRPHKHPWAMYFGAFWVGLVLLCAIFAEWLPLADSDANITPTQTPPFHSWPEFLGTDQLGRSVISRLVYGARVSLTVSVVAALIGITIGVMLGLSAGAWRRADGPIGVLTDAALAIPGIVLLLALGAAMGAGTKPLIIGLTIFSIPSFTRLARANTKAVINREYVQASKLMGAPARRWLLREVLPSVLRPVLALAVVIVASLMVAEASVSFLGLGVRPPTPSWGGMISQGQANLREHPEQVYIPAFVLFLTVLSINAIGRWLRARSTPLEAKL
jgi:peptide/nickel transport system permease protein